MALVLAYVGKLPNAYDVITFGVGVAVVAAYVMVLGGGTVAAERPRERPHERAKRASYCEWPLAEIGHTTSTRSLRVP